VPIVFVSCVGVSIIPVIFSTYSSLGVDLGELFDRSKDKPALIMLSAVVGIWLTLTLLFVGGPVSNFVVGGSCVLLVGFRKWMPISYPL
jgi:hypothetical protein